MQLGDARRGKLAGNIAGFGRALAPRRRAHRQRCASRWRPQAAMLVGVDSRPISAPRMEAVMISREQDRGVFRELFDAWFRDPELANKLLAQMLPSAEGKAEPIKRRPRVREALAPPQRCGQAGPDRTREVDFDAAMTASDRQRLHHADFNALGAAEYRLVERLARDIALPVPTLPRAGCAPAGDGGVHSQLHWPGVLHEAARTGGELLRLRAPAAPPSSRCRCWCWSTCRARWSAMPACCWPFCMRRRGGRAGATCSPSAPI